MKTNIGKIITVASVAALYAVFTYLSVACGLAYGGIQFRISEALMILALFSGEAVWGLALGCVIGNLASPFAAADVVFGSMATVLAALTIRFVVSRIKSTPWQCVLTALFTALFNSFIISAELVLFAGLAKGLFWITALQIGAGELAVCLLLCYPLHRIITKNKILNKFFVTKRS